MNRTRPLRLLGLVLLMAACGTRRTYPLMQFEPEPTERQPVQWSGVAILADGMVVAANENRSDRLYGFESAEQAADVSQLFRLTDPSAPCRELSGRRERRRCRNDSYRASVQMRAMPIAWMDGPVPQKIQDLAPYPSASGQRVLGITEFSSIARVTDYRADALPLTRSQSERMFVLERAGDGWRQVPDDAVDRMRQHLSDWGRANCGDDFIIEGLAVDGDGPVVYIGVNRCEGAVQRALAYDLGASRVGAPAPISVIADGIEGPDGDDIAGPSEGLSSLDFHHGALWATSSWNDFGDPREIAYGARQLQLVGDHFEVVPAPVMVDRADAMALLPSDEPSAAALYLFDNDRDAGKRPNGTVVGGYTPAPEEAYVSLLSLGPAPRGDSALGLNGFDFRWYQRDHRLGDMSVVLDRAPDQPGGWTSALGGLWQVRLGELASALGFLGTPIGENRQAVEVTDYSDVQGLEFTSYQAVLSVIPRELTGSDVSIAQLLEDLFEQGTVDVTLPVSVSDGTGVVLQGFRIDTSPRADGGICLSAMDLDASLVDASTVRLRAGLIGGLCNDFNTQSLDEYHGLTTDPDAGVRVTLYFATVEGGQAQRTGGVVAQRDRPGEREGETHAVIYDATARPPLAPYRRPPGEVSGRDSPTRIGNPASKDNLACVALTSESVTLLERGKKRHAPEDDEVEWMARAYGDPTTSGMQGSLSGFTFAFDLRGFEPTLYPDAYTDVTPLSARNQNLYIYRYLLRAWPDEALFLEGGMSHGLHLGGLGRDNAMPTAMMLRAELTTWDGLQGATRHISPSLDPRRDDPNLLPEDGYTRWSVTEPLVEVPSCYSR